MNDLEWTTDTQNVEETLDLGRRWGAALRGGEVIGLVGPLGAGKTHFVKGIAAGVGAPVDLVTSPTFVLVNEYPGRVYVYHLDAYRLLGSADARRLGIEEMVGEGRVVIVEWADRVHDALPPDRLTVQIEPVEETKRRFRFHAHGQTAIRLLNSAR